MANQGQNNSYATDVITGQGQLRNNENNYPSSQDTTFLHQAGEGVKSMAHGAVQGATTIAQGAALGAANIVEGAASAVKSTFGPNADNTPSSATTTTNTNRRGNPTTRI